MKTQTTSPLKPILPHILSDSFGSLVLVNAAHPLPALKLPALTNVLQHPTQETAAVLLERQAAALLEACVKAAGGAEEIVPVSGWRSRQEQQQIWDDTLAAKGAVFTSKYVAFPGCSEHETGLAIDLARRAPQVDFIRPNFPDDGACGTFRRICAQYGFILRYPAHKEQITGIAHEPWHFRYVGAPHAAYLTSHDLCLEEYIALLHEKSLTLSLSNGRSTHIFYADAAAAQTFLQQTADCVQISGDNANGFILTSWGDAT